MPECSAGAVRSADAEQVCPVGPTCGGRLLSDLRRTVVSTEEISRCWGREKGERGKVKNVENDLPVGVSVVIGVGAEAVRADGSRGIAVVVGIKANGVVSYVSRRVSEIVGICPIGLVANAAGSIAVVVGVETHGAVAYGSGSVSVVIRVETYGLAVIRVTGAVAVVVTVKMACRRRGGGQEKSDRQTQGGKLDVFHGVFPDRLCFDAAKQ